MKDELGRKIIVNFIGLGVKTFSSSTDDGSEDKISKDTKKYVIKRKLKFENYKSCLEVTQPQNKINYLKKYIEIDSF